MSFVGNFFDWLDSFTGVGKSANAINAANGPGFQPPPQQSSVFIIGAPKSSGENIETRKRSPDDSAIGALAGGGNTGLQLQPLGLRGLGGVQRTTILGA